MKVPVQHTNLKENFSELADPRQAQTKRHERVDILVIRLLAMSWGADNAEESEEYGECHEDWLWQGHRHYSGPPFLGRWEREAATGMSGTKIHYPRCDRD